MSVFGNLKNDGLEETQDRLGGFNVRDTDAYEATIKVAYAGQSQGGARNVTLVLLLADGEYNETIYVTNKAGENWFLNKQDNSKKVPLPGFTTIDDICLVTTGKPLSEQKTEEKVVKVYDYDERKELPKSVPVLTELTGQKVVLGIVKQTVDKNVKNDSTGEYEPSGETRDENTIEKVFHHPSLVTVVEAREAQKSGKDAEPVFHGKWVEKNKGVARNKTKGASGNGGQSGRPGGGAPQAGNAGGGAKKTNSLFGGK
jgi:hypothetical protein